MLKHYEALCYFRGWKWTSFLFNPFLYFPNVTVQLVTSDLNTEVSTARHVATENTDLIGQQVSHRKFTFLHLVIGFSVSVQMSHVGQ